MLVQVRVQLSATKYELFERLMDELHTQIYVRTSAAVLDGFQKNGATTTSSSSGVGAGSVPRTTDSLYLRSQPVTRSPDSESSGQSVC